MMAYILYPQLSGLTVNSQVVKVSEWRKGDITDEQKQSLLDVANKCPVHKILSNPIQINTTIG